VYAWGQGNDGQLGVGSTANSSVPLPVALPGGVTPIAVSEGYGTSLAVGADGRVYAWGANQFGQLGDGTTAESRTPGPVSLPGGVAATAVSEGRGASLALSANGRVYAWGLNQAGQLGGGTTKGPARSGHTTCGKKPTAVSLPGGVQATAVSEGGSYTSYALGANGTVYAWGGDAYRHPVAVSLPGRVKARAVSAGATTTLALGADGNVYAWSARLKPVKVRLPRGVVATAVSAGSPDGLALSANGSVYSWDFDQSDRTRKRDRYASVPPVQVALPSSAVATAVSAGAGFYLALGAGGSVYAWGANQYGQLGDGTKTRSGTPVQVTLPDGATATAISAGSGASLAIGTESGTGTGTGTAVSTTTQLTASLNPAPAGTAVTLTATEVAADGTHPAGSVQFEVGGTSIGQPVAVDASGTATTTETFASPGTATVSAVFTPADTTAYQASTGTLIVTVNPVATSSGTIPLAAGIPQAGAFTLTVDTADTVTLAVSGASAVGQATPIVASDTRNTFPGWSVSGQDTDWAGTDSATGASIPGDQLGWAPTSSGTLPNGVTLGAVVPPGDPGLGSAAGVLASATAGLGNGYGTTTLGAALTLVIPAGQTPGPYTANLTFTAVDVAP
jgi:alpha-tubulin suppressor-like RCC1 family protein